MSLGFSVEALVGAARQGAALRMGLKRLPEADWLQRDFDAGARAAVFDACPEAIRLLPGSEAAAREAASVVAGHDALEDAARAGWEDLCVLEAETSEGPYRLTAAAVGFPTDWHLAEKIGLPVTAIHAPIHGYAEQLAAGVDHFLRTLAPGAIFARANWFVVESDTWRHLPQGDVAARFAHVRADNAGETLYVRCERQTLRKLPETGAVLFTIGVALAPLSALPGPLVRQIADALGRQPEGELARRAAPGYHHALGRYARSRDAIDTAAPQAHAPDLSHSLHSRTQ